MSTTRNSLTRTLLLVFAGIISLALLIASIALLIWVINGGNQAQPAPGSNVVMAAQDRGDPAPSAGGAAGTAVDVRGKRFTLRLGQGFRFKDSVVVAKQEDQPDVVFKYVPPQLGGA